MPYPTTLDNLPEDAENQTDAVTGEPDPEYTGPEPTGEGDHAERHNDAAAAINAIETELGLDPSGVSINVTTRLEGIDTTLGLKASKTEVTSEETRAKAAEALKASKTELTTEEERAKTAEALKASKTELTTEKEARETADAGKASKGEVTTEKEARETADALKLVKSSNLSDLANAATARTNLGLGSAAVKATTDFDAAGLAAAEETARKAADTAEKEAREAADALRPVGQVVALGANVGPIKEQTTLQDITGLALVIGSSATEIWRASYWVIYEAANTTMDIEFGFSVPASCTMRWGAHNNTTNTAGWTIGPVNNTPLAMTAAGGVRSFPTGNTGNAVGINIIALVYSGGTSGNVQLKYAQDVSDAGNLTILKGTVLEAVKIAA